MNCHSNFFDGGEKYRELELGCIPLTSAGEICGGAADVRRHFWRTRQKVANAQIRIRHLQLRVLHISAQSFENAFTWASIGLTRLGNRSRHGESEVRSLKLNWSYMGNENASLPRRIVCDDTHSRRNQAKCHRFDFTFEFLRQSKMVMHTHIRNSQSRKH
jgi:hypothetical protein